MTIEFLVADGLYLTHELLDVGRSGAIVEVELFFLRNIHEVPPSTRRISPLRGK